VQAAEPVTISHKTAIDARMWGGHGIGSYREHSHGLSPDLRIATKIPEKRKPDGEGYHD